MILIVRTKQIGNEHSHKKGIFLTARVHPGETNSSFMVEGAIDFFVGDSYEASLLRKHCIIKIIPMLNPDGVIYGNYRCSLLGVDLNRRWKHPNINLHPTIYHAKKALKKLSNQREIVIYCDMHGHSIKKNAFMYACANKRPNSYQLKQNISARLIPYLLSLSNPHFSYQNSHFRLEKSKQSTARIVSFKDIRITNSYTLEASFFGPDKMFLNDPYFNIKDLKLVGEDLCKVLTVFLSSKEFQFKIKQLIQFLRKPYCNFINISSPIGSKIESSVNRYDIEENLVNIDDEVKNINEDSLDDIFLKDESSGSGGSDSEASINDEKKVKYMLSKKKIKKKKKVEDCLIKSNHIIKSPRFSQIRTSCITPDVCSRQRPRSKISLIKKSDVLYQKLIPSQVIIFPYLEENLEDSTRIAVRVNKSTGKSVLFKQNTSIRPYRTRKNVYYNRYEDPKTVFSGSMRKLAEKYVRKSTIK